MITAQDGGPAFPAGRYVYETGPGTMVVPAQSGMSLRDWFAGIALTAIPHIGCGCDLNTSDLAEAAYQLADAMLKARER